jgi:hypothetical protein
VPFLVNFRRIFTYIQESQAFTTPHLAVIAMEALVLVSMGDRKGCKQMFSKPNPRKALVTFLAALLPLGVSLGTETLAAQGVSYSTVSRGEFGGSLGTLMRLVPGAQDESRETTHFQGAFMRTDSEESSTIMNFGEGRFTLLEHPDKSFFSYTFEEMMAAMSAGMAEAEADRAAAEADAKEAEAEQAEEPEVTFEVKLSSERTGRTMEIGGYPAEQFLMVIEVVPATEEAIQEAADSGSMAVLSEIWISRDVPGWEELKKAQEEFAAQALGNSGASAQAEALQQALASDPRMQDAYKENLKALEEMDGLAVKTVTSFVTVPPGMTLDKEQVLAMADQPLSEGVGEAVADAAAEEAKEAASGAVRNLTRGILGRRRQQEEEPKEEAQPEPAQFILMRVTSLVEEIITGPLPDELFHPPADYQEKDPPWKGTDG